MDSQNDRKTLSGTRHMKTDILDIPNSINAIRIGGSSGIIGDILRKNKTTNKLEYSAETIITGSPPITVSSGVVSLNSNIGSKDITTTGTISTGILTASGNINANGNIVGDMLQIYQR